MDATITTTFSRWQAAPVEGMTLLWQNPATAIRAPQVLISPFLSHEMAQTLAMVLGGFLFLAGLTLVVHRYHRSRKFYAVVALSVIFSLLVTPLIQAEQVRAFSIDQDAQASAQEARHSAQDQLSDLQRELSGRDFNPRQNPQARLASNTRDRELGDDPQMTTSAQRATDHNSRGSATAFAANNNLLVVCDSSASGLDCDGDGLDNEIELAELGTDPDLVDSDGDSISDKSEVEGFLSGSQWYLDPNSIDSNGDGLLDTVECPELVDVDEDGNLTTPTGSACVDSDSDGTPDVFDFDNDGDGDGVPDNADGSPFYTGDLSANLQSKIDLNLSGYTTDKVVTVEFELRPTDVAHLWQTNNYLDWPSDDSEGQITRVYDTVFEDSDGADANGDLLLTPLLEITVPAPANNVNNPSGRLPISATFGGDIASSALTDWLDQDFLDEYSISVIENEDGSLAVYVPLIVIEDEVGETAVAWGGQMPYRPESGTWGEDHEAKLLWMITAMVDSCNSDAMPTDELTTTVDGESITLTDADDIYDNWCDLDRDDGSNWETEESVVQTYYEDFTLTGLSVSEDHGLTTAVIAQVDAADANVHYSHYLWHMADSLLETMLAGTLVDRGGTDSRFAISDIESRFGAGSGYSDGDPELWSIPTGKLAVASASYDDEINGLADLGSNGVPDLLDTTFGAPATPISVTLLVAREQDSRSLSLEVDTVFIVNGSSISVDVEDAIFDDADLGLDGDSGNGAVEIVLSVVDDMLMQMTAIIEDESSVIVDGELLSSVLSADLTDTTTLLLAYGYGFSPELASDTISEAISGGSSALKWTIKKGLKWAGKLTSENTGVYKSVKSGITVISVGSAGLAYYFAATGLLSESNAEYISLSGALVASMLDVAVAVNVLTSMRAATGVTGGLATSAVSQAQRSANGGRHSGCCSMPRLPSDYSCTRSIPRISALDP